MKRDIWGSVIARIQPYLLSVALLVFAWAGTLAGYAGVPRRTADISFGGAAPKSWEALMNVAMGVGGTLTLIAGILFFVVIGMTMFAGKKLRVASDLGSDLATLEMRPIREFVYTPTALIPGIIFVLVVLVFTAGAFGVMSNWPIQFG